MRYIHMSTFPNISEPTMARSNVWMSIYLQTTLMTSDTRETRMVLTQILAKAIGEIEVTGIEDRLIYLLPDHLERVPEDNEYRRSAVLLRLTKFTNTGPN